MTGRWWQARPMGLWILLCWPALPALAQGPGVIAGPLVGLNRANLGGSDVVSSQAILAPVFGGYADFPVARLLTLRLEFRYSGAGADSVVLEQTQQDLGPVNLRVGYLDFPLMLKLATGGQGTKAYLLGGGVVAFRTRCTFEAPAIGITDAQPCSKTSRTVQEVDLQAIGGIGADVQLGSLTATVSVRYTYGFRSLGQDPGYSVKNRVWSLVVGVGFPVLK